MVLTTHAAQHMLTNVSVGGAAGIENVEWDAVELPSQFMEHWCVCNSGMLAMSCTACQRYLLCHPRCFRPDTLAAMTSHEETGEPIPSVVIDRLNNARRHMAGTTTVAPCVVPRVVPHFPSVRSDRHVAAVLLRAIGHGAAHTTSRQGEHRRPIRAPSGHREDAHGTGASTRGPLPVLLYAHLRWRLRGGVLFVQGSLPARRVCVGGVLLTSGVVVSCFGSGRR